MGVTAAPTVIVLIAIVLRVVRVREAIKGVGDIGARNSTLRDHVLKRVEAIKYYKGIVETSTGSKTVWNHGLGS